MRKALPAILFALAGAGCFFGGEGDTSTAVEATKTSDTLPKVALVTPGLYVAEYPPWSDSTRPPLQAEINIAADGTFRMFWIDDNKSSYERHGNWAQRDSNLYFANMQESWLWFGIIGDFTSLDPDTNSLAQVTDTSFMRREYTPLRQKPYWVTYYKKIYPPVKDGVYEFIGSYMQDTLPPAKLTLTITLKKGVYFSSLVKDTTPVVQDSAKWYQIGSFLATEKTSERSYVDSTRTFAPWDTLHGLMMTRMRAISDTSFQLWSPAGYLDSAETWIPSRRVQ